MRFKNIITTFLILAFAFALIGCAEKENLTITHNEFGTLNEDTTVQKGMKFAPSDHELVVAMEVENNTKEDHLLDGVWQYREQGAFREIMRASNTMKPGVNVFSFPLQSNIDLFRGEYMVEIYEGENLFTAYRFWVLPEEKKANNELGLYMLSRCSINATEEKCNADEACESFYFKPEKYNDQEVFVCEAR